MSNLLKPGRYIEISDRRKLEVPELHHEKAADSKSHPSDNPDHAAGEKDPLERERMAQMERRQQEIIAKARRQAAQLVAEAKAECEQMRADAEAEIERWWTKRRQEDETRVAEVCEAGRQEGYNQGRAEAEEQIKTEYEHRLEQAQALLERAYADKERIIAEAEPFLLELSVAIAEKVIGKQLELSPDWILEMIKQVLKRRSDHGTITLCVAPEQYEFVADAKDDLAYVLDAQADLKIIPDKNVRDNGCIVRSRYGSMDARIDTQLSEIKQVLIQLYEGDAGGGPGHAES